MGAAPQARPEDRVAEFREVFNRVESEIGRARSRLARGEGLLSCEDCGKPIPEARRRAVPGVRRCVQCQGEADKVDAGRGLYNRRGNKDSQLK